ncbi:MAG: helix-hairpin-helix domain-containing protein [Weeksellaceae bacterium]|jgi:DNA uptake protein ComE-like DNA-binding protein|nr:helix-hairpin-helix domain-containing protein [Weeksellaceae bacterium]
MRTFAKSRIRYTKSQRLGIFAFIVLLIGFELFSYFHSTTDFEEFHSIPNELLAVYSQSDSSSQNESFYSLTELSNFNPNSLSKEEWMELGFSEKQAGSILKYKYSLGGNFSSKEEIKNCYVISEKKFSELEPFIKISSIPAITSNISYSYEVPTVKIRYKKFNPNTYSEKDWEAIGFSEKQAMTILKYKNSLGGEFSTLEEIANCFVISSEKFQEMKPYIILPKKDNSLTNSEVFKKQEITIQKFNPNQLKKEEWMDLGFSEKQAQVILNYKNSLGGTFAHAESLSKCYVINEEKMEELLPYLTFDD